MWPLPLSVAEQQIGSMRSPRPHCFCECEAAFPTPCFQHGRTHTKQIRGRSLKSKPREIQTESRQPYSFRFPNIAKLLFKRVKYISIRREKSLTQRGNNAAILVDFQIAARPVVTIVIGGFWLAVLRLASLAALGLDSLAELLRMSFLNELMVVIYKPCKLQICFLDSTWKKL